MKRLNEKIKYWHELTELNNHTEVRIEIADFFGYANLRKLFEEIRDEQNRARSIDEPYLKIRTYATDEMLGRIANEYGAAFARKVENAL